MRVATLLVSGVAWATAVGWGQASGPEFEAASLKPAAADAVGIVCSGGPGTASPGIFRCTNVPLAFLVTQAYGFPAYQFAPMAACCRSRFDVTAKVAAGSTKAQFRQMLQALLVERFQFRFHYERKEMAVYELSVAAQGLKMREAAAGVEGGAGEDPWAAPEYRAGKDGYAEFPAGRGGVAGMNGRYRWKGLGVSMEEMVRTLSFQLGGPVADATGLAGRYDFDLRWGIDLAWVLEGSGRPELVGELAEQGPQGPGLVGAVQSQLGLKLTARQGAAEIVVVDHVAKAPGGN